MANKDEEDHAQPFTFVGYDVNARGVSDMVRSHLMEVRARNKRGSRPPSTSSRQYAALPWRYAGMGNPTTTTPSRDQEPTSRESVQQGKQAQTFSQAQSEYRSPSESVATASTGGGRESPMLSTTRIYELAEGLGAQLHVSDSREVSPITMPGEGSSARVSHSSHTHPPSSEPPLSVSRSKEPSHGEARHMAIETGVFDSIPWQLDSSDAKLLEYFLANGVMMMQFHLHWKIEATHKPIEKIFLPVALSAQWCFEAMVLLSSAHHRYQTQHRPRDAEELATIQTRVLKAAQERISAIFQSGDSNDADVMAFLFLAINEFRFGDKHTGAMHLDAWQRYLIMRRECAVDVCSAPCKIAVWWCLSMLLGPDDPLPVVLDRRIIDRIREDPERLFRGLAADNS